MSPLPRFLLLDIPERGGVAFLDPEQSSHCARVLRLSNGSQIQLINGKGSEAIAEITEAHSHKTVIKVLELKHSTFRSQIHLVFGLTKPQSLDFIFKKCTEIGVASFQPLITDHSLHRTHFNQERWLKLVIEACKQSQEIFFPEVHSPQDFSVWLKKRNPQNHLIICDEDSRSGAPSKWSLPLAVLIGPEGGWSVSERLLLKDAENSSWLGLGKNRLRAETACLAALTILKWNSGELSC